MKRFACLLLTAVLLMTGLLVACTQEPDDPPADPPASPEQPADPDPDPEPEPEPEPEQKRFRIVMSPDVHCTRLLAWNGLTTEQRMQMWVDAIIEEHETDPIDLLVLQGDMSLDHWLHGGNWIDEGESDTEYFFYDFVCDQLPDEIEVFFLPGNHEQFGEELWEDMLGNPRQSHVVMGNHLILLLDNFAGELDPDYHHDGVYTGIDMDYVNEVVSEHPDKDIWMITHFTHLPYESEEFKEFLRTNTRIKAIFHGHNHTLSVEDLGEEYNHVKLIMCGQFSYTNSKEPLDQYYSFRDLILYETGAQCSYIIPEIGIKINGENVEYQYETDVIFD